MVQNQSKVSRAAPRILVIGFQSSVACTLKSREDWGHALLNIMCSEIEPGDNFQPNNLES